MNFQTDYEELIECAARVCKKRELDLDPAELVNEAYIKFIDSGDAYDIEQIKRSIVANGWKEFQSACAKISFDEGLHEYSKFSHKKSEPRYKIETLCCTVCKEDKPIMQFRTVKRGIGYVYIVKTCANCLDKRRIEWQRKNKEQWAAYMRTRRPQKNKIARPIQDLWKEANRRYQAKQKELLTDVYIRVILKASNKPYSQKHIEEKRQEILENRKRKDAAQFASRVEVTQ